MQIVHDRNDWLWELRRSKSSEMMDKVMAGEDPVQDYNSMRKQEQPLLSINNELTSYHFDMYDLYVNLSYVYIKVWS